MSVTPIVVQCAFKLHKSQISLMDALESGDAYLLNAPLDIEVDVFLTIRFDGLHTGIGEIDASGGGHQRIVYSKGRLRSPSRYKMSEYEYVVGAYLFSVQLLHS
jgi:hypothetical protein